MADKLIVDKQKEVISKIVDFLSHEDPNLYYTDSNTIAKMVLEVKDEAKLNKDEIDLIKDLSTKDVLVLMSFHSNCC